jgi:hypothetical protein
MTKKAARSETDFELCIPRCARAATVACLPPRALACSAASSNNMNNAHICATCEFVETIQQCYGSI